MSINVWPASTQRLHWLFLVTCILVLAAIIHIAVILVLPKASRAGRMSGVWNSLTALKTVPIDADTASTISPRFLDPSAAMAVCPFRLDQHPVRITMPLGDGLVSLSFHDFDGRVFYALNDRAGQKGVIDLVLMVRRQLDEALSADEDDEVAKDVRLLSPVAEGIVVVRVLAMQPSERAAAKSRAMQLQCESERQTGSD